MNPSTASLYLLRALLFVASIGPAHAAGQEQGTVAYADAVAASQALNVEPADAAVATDTKAAAVAPPRAITRITLSASDMPAASRQRDLPNFQAPPAGHQLERDVRTLKAARAAMLQQDANHLQQRMAALR
ncbi:hypothetical protein LJR289_002169 [Pseudoduganella sp. LjRoot289]|uniref:hypothetical protein n=1 Tax=Pseudoduganella sp. LjRoot289 TaxID=3342314 RepID=UPI003ECE867F